MDLRMLPRRLAEKNPTMLRIVVRWTNYLAGMMALLLSLLLWAGQPLILSLMTNQPALIAFPMPIGFGLSAFRWRFFWPFTWMAFLLVRHEVPRCVMR